MSALAFRLLNERRLEDGVDHIVSLLRRSTSLQFAWVRADLLLHFDDYEAALADFRNALELAPENSRLVYGAAAALFMLARYRETIEEMALLDASRPENALILGQSYKFLGDDLMATGLFLVAKEAARVGDCYGRPDYAALALALALLDEYEPALEAASHVGDSPYDVRLANWARAVVHVRRGDLDSAYPLLQDLSEARPGDVARWMTDDEIAEKPDQPRFHQLLEAARAEHQRRLRWLYEQLDMPASS